MTKYVFLDIDGVLNSETKVFPNGKRAISWEHARRFNQILVNCDPLIVVSSTWRYEVLDDHMTLMGFEHMLRRFGVDCEGRLIGVLGPDRYGITRGDLVTLWLSRFIKDQYQYVILDDGDPWTYEGSDHGMRDAGHEKNLVHTDSIQGLTNRDVLRAISILNKGKKIRSHSVPF